MFLNLTFIHIYQHCMYRDIMKYLSLFLPCKHGKCSSFIFTLAWINHFAKLLYPKPLITWFGIFVKPIYISLFS